MSMTKRERLEKTIHGEEADRVPVALWRHWPGDDQRAADLVEATWPSAAVISICGATPASADLRLRGSGSVGRQYRGNTRVRSQGG